MAWEISYSSGISSHLALWCKTFDGAYWWVSLHCGVPAQWFWVLDADNITRFHGLEAGRDFICVAFVFLQSPSPPSLMLPELCFGDTFIGVWDGHCFCPLSSAIEPLGRAKAIQGCLKTWIGRLLRLFGNLKPVEISKNDSNIICLSSKNTFFFKIIWMWLKIWACHAHFNFEI